MEIYRWTILDNGDDDIFCRTIGQRTALSHISSQDHYQRSHHRKLLTCCEQDLNLRRTKLRLLNEVL